MPTCFDDDGEEKLPDLEEALKAFQDENIPEEFRTESLYDYGNYEAERKMYEEENLSSWDRQISSSEREAIARLNLETISSDDKCPYLIKATGSEDYYYCAVLANEFFEKGKINGKIYTRFSGAIADDKSAEALGHLLPSNIEEKCLEFKSCKNYIAQQKKKYDEKVEEKKLRKRKN